MTAMLLDIFGWFGTFLILSGYLLNSFGKIRSSSPLYHWMNVIGAFGVMIVSGHRQAWQPACLNLVWLFVGLTALTKPRRPA